MDKRNKAEQFRKTRKNFLKRAYKIGVNSDVEMYILMKRKNKFYTFTNTSHKSWPSQAELDRGVTIAKSARDFEPVARPKRKFKHFTALEQKEFALSELGIKIPVAPQLNLCSG